MRRDNLSSLRKYEFGFQIEIDFVDYSRFFIASNDNYETNACIAIV